MKDERIRQIGDSALRQHFNHKRVARVKPAQLDFVPTDQPLLSMTLSQSNTAQPIGARNQSWWTATTSC